MDDPYPRSPYAGGRVTRKKGANWPLIIGLGCLGCFVLMVGAGAGCLTLVSKIMRSSDAYKLALAQVQAHPEVTKRIGSPVESGWFVSGNVRTSGPSGNASLSFPVSGPKGKATVYVQAVRAMGRWKLTALAVDFEASRERVDLLKPKD